MINNPYLRKLMKTPFVKYYVCDADGNHTEINRQECFQFPIHKDQRWASWFDEKDPKNPSNIIVRLAPTEEGKKVGNRNFADNRSETRRAEEESEFEFISYEESFNFVDMEDSPLMDEPVAHGADPQELITDDCDQKAIFAELKELLPGNYPQLAYDVLVLRKTERELAPKYGCSPKTIGNRKRKIMEILQESELLRGFYEAL